MSSKCCPPLKVTTSGRCSLADSSNISMKSQVSTRWLICPSLTVKIQPNGTGARAVSRGAEARSVAALHGLFAWKNDVSAPKRLIERRSRRYSGSAGHEPSTPKPKENDMTIETISRADLQAQLASARPPVLL